MVRTKVLFRRFRVSDGEAGSHIVVSRLPRLLGLLSGKDFFVSYTVKLREASVTLSVCGMFRPGIPRRFVPALGKREIGNGLELSSVTHHLGDLCEGLARRSCGLLSLPGSCRGRFVGEGGLLFGTGSVF